MSGKCDLGAYVDDMVRSCESILMFSRDVSDEDLLDDASPTGAAILHHLMILGEASKRVPPEWTQRYADIPWKPIAGLRDKIVHYYFGIDGDVIVSTARNSIPAILPQLRAMLEEMDAMDAPDRPAGTSDPREAR